MSDVVPSIARKLKLSPEQVRGAAELLDAGNTISFIARFRKDQTHGLEAEQLQEIRRLLTAQRAFEERRVFIRKAIEAQNALTSDVQAALDNAATSRDLEDIYLPFKTGKQPHAQTARQQGLEPFADEIITGALTVEMVAARAAELVRVEKGLNSADDVMAGVRHLMVEKFANNSELRSAVREIAWKTGSLACKIIPQQVPNRPAADSPTADAGKQVPGSEGQSPAIAGEAPSTETPAESESSPVLATGQSVEGNLSGETNEVLQPVEASQLEEKVADREEVGKSDSPGTDERIGPPAVIPTADSGEVSDEVTTAKSILAEPSAVEPSPLTLVAETTADPPVPDVSGKDSTAPAKKKKRKKKKRKPAQHPFADFEGFAQPLKKVPHHRLLAINRGEKAGLVRARIKLDVEAVDAAANGICTRPEHPVAMLMTDCIREAVNRNVIPSLEREIRREMTEAAETHAVTVFAKNLRALLMQYPVSGEKLLAIDPGYKSGCSVAIVDSEGNFLAAEKIFVVGNNQRKEENRKKLLSLIQTHDVKTIVIGNGTACSDVEQLVSAMIGNELKDHGLRYTVVNEAGASVYALSEIGKEELPELDVGARAAVSIARRLIDPLSELVKIEPAHLGIGLYQHDIRSRHLAESLDDIVRQCVNAVGVNVNTASPSLLRYVSGLNQLTARRLYEARKERRFVNRENIREVAGIGDATFVQAAGFLRVYGGDQPLDETPIHPESYSATIQLLESVGSSPADWRSAISRKGDNAANAGDEKSAEGIDVSAPPVFKVESLMNIKPAEFAAKLDIGELLMKDIIDNLSRPYSDPRTSGRPPVFRTGMIAFEDLQPEMKLEAQVVNVVDFGAFVDVGLGHTSLVHISELSAGFIHDLHQEISVGDVLTVWVKEIDAERRRAKLTAIAPGTARSERPGRSRRQRRPGPVQQEGQKREAGLERSGNIDRSKSGGRGTGRGDGEQERGNRQQGRRSGRGPDRFQRSPGGRDSKRTYERKPSKPKFIKPIEEEMLRGDKPMRSFSDLAQFFKKKDPESR